MLGLGKRVNAWWVGRWQRESERDVPEAAVGRPEPCVGRAARLARCPHGFHQNGQTTVWTLCILRHGVHCRLCGSDNRIMSPCLDGGRHACGFGAPFGEPFGANPSIPYFCFCRALARSWHWQGFGGFGVCFCGFRIPRNRCRSPLSTALDATWVIRRDTQLVKRRLPCLAACTLAALTRPSGFAPSVQGLWQQWHAIPCAATTAVWEPEPLQRFKAFCSPAVPLAFASLCPWPWSSSSRLPRLSCLCQSSSLPIMPSAHCSSDHQPPSTGNSYPWLGLGKDGSHGCGLPSSPYGRRRIGRLKAIARYCLPPSLPIHCLLNTLLAVCRRK